MNPFITLTTTDGHPVRINVNRAVFNIPFTQTHLKGA